MNELCYQHLALFDGCVTAWPNVPVTAHTFPLRTEARIIAEDHTRTINVNGLE